MELPITCDSKRRLEYVSLKELNTFQGELVELSKEGYQAMKDSLTRYGFFMPIFYWIDPADGLRKVIDGHQRKRVLEREGWTVEGGKFPVVDVEAKSEQEAAEKLLQMRGNHGKVTEQGLYEFLATKGVDLASIPNPDIPYINIDQFTQNYYTDPLDVESEDGEKVETHGIHAFNEEAIFEGDNLWDIPDLREDRLVTELPDNLGMWLGTPGETAIDKVVNQNTIYRTAFNPEWAKDAFMCFYEEDESFERVWIDAVAMVEKYYKMGWKGIVAPDFTIYDGDPAAIRLYNVYRNRWCARYWQEAGLNIIPNLGMPSPMMAREKYAWYHAGMPRSAPVVAVQCRSEMRKSDRREKFAQGMKLAMEDFQPEQCIIYGGEEARKWLAPHLPKSVKYHYLTSWVEGRFKKYRKGEVVSQSAANVAAAQQG